MCQGSAIARPRLGSDTVQAERRRFRQALRSGGYAVTAQRRAAHDRTCAEHILEAIRRDHPAWRMNKTTVYRNLDLLQSLGLVREMRRDDGRAQYELALHGRHGHLICSRCGEPFDLEPALAVAQQEQLRQRSGFGVDLPGMPCTACVTTARPAGRRIRPEACAAAPLLWPIPAPRLQTTPWEIGWTSRRCWSGSSRFTATTAAD